MDEPRHRVIYLVRMEDGTMGAFESRMDALIHAAMSEEEGVDCTVYSCALLPAGCYGPTVREAMKPDHN